MGGELRSLSFVVELIDRATKPLQNIMGLGESLDRSTIEIGVEAVGTEAAASSFSKLQGGIAKLTGLGDKMGEQLGEAGQKVSEAGAKVKQVWDPASQSFIQVAAAANQAAQGVEKVTQKMGPLQAAATRVSGAIDDVKGKLLGIQVAAGAFMYSAIGSAAEVERLENVVKSGFGEGAEGILKWAEAGGKLTGVTNESRMAMALLFQQAKMGNEQIMTSTELVEKYWKNKALRNKLQTAGIGSKEALAENIKDVEIGGGRAFGLKKIWGKEALDDVIQNGRGAKKVLSLMRKDLEKTADTSDDTLSAQADLSEAWGEFTEEAGKGLLGPMTKIFKLLTGVIQLIQSIPGGATVAGLGAAFAFVAVSLVFMTGMLANAILSIGTLIGAERLAALQSKAWAAAQYLAAGASGVLSGAVGVLTGALQVMKAAMLSNPLTAAFVILLAVLILLETKFHVFSNLFKSLEKVDWAGKWAASVTYLTGLWDGLIDRVSWVKGLVSGGLGALSKIGGGNVAVGGLMVAIPGIGVMVVILKLLHGSIKSLLDMSGYSTQFLKDIYSELRKQFEKALGFLGSLIPDWLSRLFVGIGEAFKSFDWLKGLLVVGINAIIGGLNGVISAFNALLTALKISFQVPLLGLVSTKEEEVKAKGGAVESDAQRHQRILAENLTAYNIDQAAGSEFGSPAQGADSVKGYQPAFGGEFGNYNFQSTRYPDLQRTGEELTEEQLLTGEWTPKNLVDEFGGFMGDLTAAQKQAFNDRLAAAKAAKVEIKAEKVEIEAEESESTPAAKTPFTPSVPGDAFKPVSLQEAGEGVFTSPASGEASIASRTPTPVEAMKEASTGSSTKIQTEVSLMPTISAPGGEAKKEKGFWESAKESIFGSSEPEEEESSPAPAPAAATSSESSSSSSAPAASSTPASSGKTADQQAYDDAWNRADDGGRITRTGRGTIHEGEEVVSEKDKLMYNTGEVPTILQGIDRITSRLRGTELPPVAVAAPQAAAPTTIREGDRVLNLYGPFLRIEKVTSQFDFDRMQNDLIKFLREEIKSSLKG
jgi:hypothetical protein